MIDGLIRKDKEEDGIDLIEVSLWKDGVKLRKLY
jgi:hypothetical protein